MYVKSTFLNGILEEEVYIEQRVGFVDVDNKNMVCISQKYLYGLKQASRAWYERLHTYLMKIGFERTSDNNNLYIKKEKGKGIFLSKFFVDDIIFGGQDTLCKAFTNKMRQELRCLCLERSIFLWVCKSIRYNMVYVSLSQSMSKKY